MNQQEIVERDVRMLIGDLSVQLIAARARIIELESRLPGEANDKDKEEKGKDDP